MSENLTEAQENVLVSKWSKIGTSSGPSDPLAIENAIQRTYINAGLPIVPVVVVSSPLALWYAVGHLHAEGKGKLLDNPDKPILDACAALKKVFPDEECAPLVLENSHFLSACDGQYEASFLSMCEGFDLLGLDIPTNDITPFNTLAMNTCIWVPGEYCAVASKRAISAKYDAVGNLHNTEGPCLEWADGVKLYAIHGVWVSEEAVLRPEKITAESVKREPNAEVRQALMLLAGSGKILRELGATEIDRSGDGVNELVLYKMAAISESSLLQVVDHTPESVGANEKGLCLVGKRAHRRYFLRVPSAVRTAKEAVSGLVGLSSDLYAPSRET